MKPRTMLFASFLAGTLCCSPSAAADSLAGRKPNIILVMTDDQGYGDLSCHGNPHLKTPNLDRLSRESVRFTDFHVSPTCSPTRAALMTGRHEFKNGVTHTILERERMTLKATTLPQVLKSAGYTTGILGKWHLGDEDAYQPGRRGFDEVFVHGAGGIGQTFPGSCGDAPGNTYFDPVIRHNDTFEKTRGYCTDVFFAQAKTWIESVKGKRPFFCYLTPNAPHAPLDCPPGSDKPYAGKVPADIARFYGMIANIDENVGQLMAKLREWGIEKETLIIFMTDNGTATGAGVFNAGMRGAKNTPYHGGTRVPAFWRWPGTLPANVDVKPLTCHWDMLPTLAELAGVKIHGDLARQVEGRSLTPLLRDANGAWADRYFFTHIGRWPHNHDPRKAPDEAKYALCSVYWRSFHMVRTGRDKKWELYDLTTDPGEKADISDKHRDVVRQLAAACDDWWTSVLPALENENAQGPPVNPYKAAYFKQYGGPGPNKVAPSKEPNKTDSFPVANRKTLAADKVECERIAVGEPDDYKPCVALLPNGELLMTAFHQHKKEGGKVLEQNLLFRSKVGGRTWSKPVPLDLLGREPYLTVLKDGTLFLTGHLLAQDVRNKYGYTHGYLHRSTNGGKSWDSIRIESEGIKPKASNHSSRNVLELADGTLLLGVDYDGGGGPYLMWRSSDGGKTWDKTQKCDPVGFKSVYGFFGGETWLWQARSGKVWALVRVDSNEFPIQGRPIKSKDDQSDHFILYSSDDRGRTFRRVADFGDYGEMYMSILRLQDKRLLLTFTVRDLAPPLGVRAIPGLETDDGFTFDFSHDRLMLDTRTGKRSQGGGFGPTVQLKDGTLVTCCSYRGEDDKTHLEVVRWKMPGTAAR